MPEKNHTVPFKDSDRTSRLMNAATVAFAELMDSVVADLPPGQQLLLTNVLEDGGRIGFEVSVDKVGNQMLQLIGFEPEGTRRPVATIVIER